MVFLKCAHWDWRTCICASMPRRGVSEKQTPIATFFWMDPLGGMVLQTVRMVHWATAGDLRNLLTVTAIGDTMIVGDRECGDADMLFLVVMMAGRWWCL